MWHKYAHQGLRMLVRFASSAPWCTVLLAATLAGIALWYTVSALEFESSRDALAGSQARAIQSKKTLKEEYNKIDYLVVVVEPPDLERGKQFVQALATRLRSDTRHFQQVIDKIDISSLEGKKLLYLSPQDLITLKQRLQDAQGLMTDLAARPGLVQLLTSINQEIRRAMATSLTHRLLKVSTSAASGDTHDLDTSFLRSLFAEMTHAIADPTTYRFRSPWEHFFLPDSDAFSKQKYLTSKHNRFLFVLVDDRLTKGSLVKHAASLRALRAHLQVLHHTFPDVRTGVTGEQALSTDEMLAAQRDTRLATVIALVGVAMLFIIVFRQVWRPLLVVITLIIAVCWTMGLATLTVGHLNILSVAFIPILIGLGIDFGIHLVARYSEERARTQNFDIAVQAAYLHTGPGVVVAALTTALSFYGVMLTNFRGLAELGWIAGSGMLLCLLASLTVLPALLDLRERHQQTPTGIWQPLAHDPLRGLKRFPRTLLGIMVLLTLLGVVCLPLPRLDYNLLNLQAHGTESVEWEYRLLEEAGRSSWYALSSADSWQELRQKQARFAALPGVDRVASLASVIPAEQAIRLPLVKTLAPYVQDRSVNWRQPQPVEPESVRLLLRNLRFHLRRPMHLGKLQTMLEKIRFPRQHEGNTTTHPSKADLIATKQALQDLRERLNTTPPEVARNALETFQRHLMDDFATKLAFLQRNVDPTPITLTDIPESLRHRFVSKKGRFLLQIFPRHNIWGRNAMQAFVTQLQTVDPDITGSPVIAYQAIQQMQRGYTHGAIYASIVIIGIVLVLFRRLGATLLALLPALFAALWTLSCMALFDLQFNMANLIIMPLFLGIAVDDGIHLVHRMREDPQNATAPLAHSTGKAIVLTSLTTMVGFGSLLVARHSGVFSLGLLTTIAVGCSLIATLVVLPLVVHLLHEPSCDLSGSAEQR